MNTRQFKKGEQFKTDERYRVAKGARASERVHSTNVPPEGSVVRVRNDGPDSDIDVAVNVDGHPNFLYYCLPKYLIPLDAEQPPVVHPDAVTLPEDPGEGKHWKECTYNEYASAASAYEPRAAIQSLDFARYFCAVPDGPAWPTEPGPHPMVRLSDGQVVAALRLWRGQWKWVGSTGHECMQDGDKNIGYLRPLTADEATTHAVLVKALADLRAGGAS